MLERFQLDEDEKKSLEKSLKIIVGLIIFTIILLIYNSTFKNDALSRIKSNRRKDLIYTVKQKTVDGRHSEVPYINIKGKNIEKLNQEIEEFTSECFKEGTDLISYQYDVSDKILSLVVKTAHFDKIYYPDFRTYNINLSDLSILTDDDILDKFNLTTTNVSNKIENRFKEFYNDMLDNNYYGGECDYNCFLYFRGDKDYLSDIHYYLKDNKLYVYKAFNVYSVYDEENYFTEDDFFIQVSE